MNKLLIVLMAVCLVSVHAFVKREAPASDADKNYMEDIQKTINEVGSKAQAQIQSAFDPEEIKKHLHTALDGLSKALDDLKKSVDSAKPKE